MHRLGFRAPRVRKGLVVACAYVNSPQHSSCAEKEQQWVDWRPKWQFDRKYRMETNTRLGSGGYGEVFVAVHQKSGVSRAVKRVRRSNAEADAALIKEYEVMKKLQDCPHIVRVYDGFIDDEYRYMVMELCFGLDLVDSLMEELSSVENPHMDMHPNIPHVAAVFREMVTAVSECHQRGVAHMDCKPENFIHMSTLSQTPGVRVKLLDFGLAWTTTGSHVLEVTEGTQLGCSKYLSPELYKRGTNVDPRPCDMYALGVSLFNLLTGRFPFNFGRVGRPRSRPDLSQVEDADARDLINILLQADPDMRLTAEEVLEHPFLVKHKNAVVEPLSEFTEHSVRKFFLETSPAAIHGSTCACATAAECPHRAVARTMKKGEVLFYEGTTDSRAVYFVTRGSFQAKKQGTPFATMGPQTVIGEHSALFDRPRYATVVAAEDSEVFEFKSFGEKIGSTQQRYAVRTLQETALQDERKQVTRDFLKSSTLFSDASEELLNMIIGGCDHMFFDEGEVVLQKEDDKMALYIVQDGLLELSTSNSSYRALMGPGDIIGEMALVFGQKPDWHETLTAVKPTSALVLDRNVFALILSKFPKEREVIIAMADWRVQQMGIGKAMQTSRPSLA